MVFSNNIYSLETAESLKNYSSIDKILYSVRYHSRPQRLNNWQVLPGDIFSCECYFEHDPSDKWNYYLVEIVNPDEAISTFFINTKRFPFITTCLPDKNGVCTLEYYIRFYRDHLLIQTPNEDRRTVALDFYLKSPDTMTDIELRLFRHFKLNFKDYLQLFQEHTRQFTDKVYFFRTLS